MELDALVRVAADKKAKDDAKRAALAPAGATLEVAADEEALETEVLGLE